MPKKTKGESLAELVAKADKKKKKESKEKQAIERSGVGESKSEAAAERKAGTETAADQAQERKIAAKNRAKTQPKPLAKKATKLPAKGKRGGYKKPID